MVFTENCHVEDCHKTLGHKDLFFVQCFINGCLNLNDGSEEIKNLRAIKSLKYISCKQSL